MTISVELTNRISKRVPRSYRQAVYRAILAYKRWTGQARYLPDYLLIGAQKAGTTSLYAYLVQHPQIGRSLRKEIHYFDRHFDRGLDWYCAHFMSPVYRRLYRVRNGVDLITGEATTHYLFHPLVPERVAQVLPDVRIMMVLRDPVERTYSSFKYYQVRQEEDPAVNFEEAVRCEAQRVEADRPRVIAEYGLFDPALSAYGHQHRGHYAEQIERWFAHFPREQFFIVNSNQLYQNPQHTMREAFSFLNLPHYEPPQYEQFNLGKRGTMSDDIRAELEAYFAPHNERLNALLGVDAFFR